MINSPPIIRQKAPDGGFGWVIVFASFMVSLISDGFSYTTGLFYAQFLISYKESEAVTSIFDSIMTGMIYCIGPFSSGLTAAYGCRRISMIGSVIAVIGMLTSIWLDNIYTHCLTLGLITGSGLGLQYIPQVMIVTFWFDKHLALATGIGVCGSGIGIAVFAVLSEYLIVSYGWKGSMLLLSGLMMTNMMWSSLFRKVPYMQEKSDLRTAFKEIFNFTILKDMVFVYLAMATFIYSSVYYVVIIFLKDHVVKTGIGTDRDAITLMVYFGLSNAFGRVFFGYLADFESLNRILIYGLSVLINGISIGLIAAFGHNFYLMIIWIVLFGLAEGTFITLSSVVIVDLFGIERVNNVFGVLNLIVGIASFIGPPLIGQTYSEETGYTTGFWITSGLTIISGILLSFMPLIHNKLRINP